MKKLKEQIELMGNFCMTNVLKILNGFYQKKDSHKYTKYRLNSNKGEFDQKSVSDSRIIQDVKVIPGDSLDFDHRLLVAEVKMR